MQESFAFLILVVGRLREDQFTYVETRENEYVSFFGLVFRSVGLQLCCEIQTLYTV